MTKLPDAHDVVAYPAFAYQSTHPSRLATMARLHGLQPAPVEACRVLEVGCNSGANLIPMAYSLPGSEFVGFDLAGVPVARGQKIEAVGLSNIRLLQADLMDADGMPELRGPFDYIIAHGVYAWVPDTVREALLSFCRKHLSARGVAFISYAALPGGYARLLSREVMQFRADRQSEDAGAGVREAMRFMEFIASTRPEGDGFRALLQRELNGLTKRNPAVVFHDELSAAYRPVSFREFTSHTAQHGLRYFSEAELPSPTDPCFQAEIAATVQQLSRRRSAGAGADARLRENAAVSRVAAVPRGCAVYLRSAGRCASRAADELPCAVEPRERRRSENLYLVRRHPDRDAASDDDRRAGVADHAIS